MDLVELNPALRQQPFELAQSNQEDLTIGQRVMEHGRAAVNAVVEKLSAPFEALDTMPVVNRRLALAGTIGAAIGGVAAYKAETASGHVPVDGAKTAPARISAANNARTTESPNDLATTSTTGSAAKIKFYKQGDPGMVREYKRLVKKGHCSKHAVITSDPYASEKNPTGESQKSGRKYGRSHFNFSNDGDSQSISVIPHKGYKPCLMQAVTVGYEIYFVPMKDVVRTKIGYKYSDPVAVSDENGRAIRSVATQFARG